MNVAIVGGSGYTGGELLRLLLRHPKVEVAQVTSDSLAGKPLSRAHPNLRRATDLTFTPHADLDPCDLLFLAMPHGEAIARMPEFLARAGKVIDLSADFRLKDAAAYREYYGFDHPRPEGWMEGVPPNTRSGPASCASTRLRDTVTPRKSNRSAA